MICQTGAMAVAVTDDPGAAPTPAARRQARPRFANGSQQTNGHRSSPPIPLVRARTLLHLPEILERMNVRFEDLLGRVGLPDVALDRASSLLPLREVLSVVEEAAHATGIENLSLLLATTGGLDALDIYGAYVKNAPTLLEAIRRADQYISWHTLGARLTLTREERNIVVWRYELSRTVRADRRHAFLFLLVLMRDVVRLAAGPGWMPDELRLEQARPVDCRDLHEAFGERIVWGAGMNALAFPEALLARPMAPQAEDQSGPQASAEAIETSTPLPEFIGSLRHLIRSYLPTGSPHAAFLARLSGHSLRSLQRRLAAAGVSCSELVEQVRCEAAFELMRDPAMRLIDVGLELGYSDAANFSRAFKRWTGLAPRSWRQSAAPA